MFDLELIAARYVLHDLYSSELPEIALSALEHGFDSPALARLAGEVEPVMADVGPLFERALQELQVAIPDPGRAARKVIRHCASLIVSGAVSPYAGARELLCRVNDHPEVRGELATLAGLEDRYCDINSMGTIGYAGDSWDRIRRETEEAITAEARRLLGIQ